MSHAVYRSIPIYKKKLPRHHRATPSWCVHECVLLHIYSSCSALAISRARVFFSCCRLSAFFFASRGGSCSLLYLCALQRRFCSSLRAAESVIFNSCAARVLKKYDQGLDDLSDARARLDYRRRAIYRCACSVRIAEAGSYLEQKENECVCEKCSWMKYDTLFFVFWVCHEDNEFVGTWVWNKFYFSWASVFGIDQRISALIGGNFNNNNQIIAICP